MLLPDFFLTNKAHNFKLPFYCRCKQFQMQRFQGDNSDLHCKKQDTRILIIFKKEKRNQTKKQIECRLPRKLHPKSVHCMRYALIACARHSCDAVTSNRTPKGLLANALDRLFCDYVCYLSFPT